MRSTAVAGVVRLAGTSAHGGDAPFDRDLIERVAARVHSTVTVFARLRGWSTSFPLRLAT